MIEYEAGVPRCTRDGVTIVKNVRTTDNRINIGVDLLKSVSHNANKFAGDGTTTAAILASSIYRNGLRLMQGGFNPIMMQRGIKKAQRVAEDFLKQIALPINHETEKERLFQVANVALSGENVLAQIVAEAIHVIGPYGSVYFEPSNQPETSMAILDGVIINRGYSSPGFLNKTTDSQVVLDDPLVLMLNMEIKDMDFLLPALEHAQQQRKPLFIIAKQLSQEVISQLCFQKRQGGIQVN
jgi:chaperonin GroEL